MKNKIMAAAIALAPLAAGLDSCAQAGGPTSHEVVAVLSPWVEDNDPAKGATPNGCEGDGKTWAVQYKTSKGGKWVTARDPKSGNEVVVTKTDCVGKEKAQGLTPGQVYQP